MTPQGALVPRHVDAVLFAPVQHSARRAVSKAWVGHRLQAATQRRQPACYNPASDSLHLLFQSQAAHA